MMILFVIRYKLNKCLGVTGICFIPSLFHLSSEMIEYAIRVGGVLATIIFLNVVYFG